MSRPTKAELQKTINRLVIEKNRIAVERNRLRRDLQWAKEDRDHYEKCNKHNVESCKLMTNHRNMLRERLKELSS